MSTIPHKFNRLGISTQSGFNLEKGLLFHAPLQENFDAIGGTLYNNPANYGWIFQTAYFGKPCVYGSTSSAGIFYNMATPILGHIPFTMSIEFFSLDFASSYFNRSLFYIGNSTINQAFGFQFGGSTGYGIGTAWGDDFVYNVQPTWKDYINAWTIFTATYDMERIKLYFNGELRFTTDPITLNIKKSTGGFSKVYGDLAIGSRWQDNRYWKNGLRNQYIYDYALSDQDVKAFYEATKGV